MQKPIQKIVLSAADTCEALDQGRGSFNDTEGRQPVAPDEVRQGRTAVMLVFGQSNGANSGDTPYRPRRRVLNFNLFDGRCYVAVDPLLGATGQGGGFAGRMADLLIERDVFDTVVLVPISVGGSRIEDWATGGIRHRRLQVATGRAFEAGLAFTHLLWHQGETDARYDPDGPRYLACLKNIHAALRGYGVDAPLYVAQATLCHGGPVEAIRAAQRSVVDPCLGILAGPDTDTIGPEDRYDGCHMAESGLIKHAKLWADVLASGGARREAASSAAASLSRSV